MNSVMFGSTFLSKPAFRRLTATDRGAYAQHLRGLSHADRRARFHGECSDRLIDARSREIDFSLCIVIGCFLEGRLAGVAEVCTSAGEQRSKAELALSVDAVFRNHGIATELTRLALDEARTRGITDLQVLCEEDGYSVCRIARRFCLTVILNDDMDTEAYGPWFSIDPMSVVA